MIWTPKGPRQVFVLAFLHMESRRVFVTPGTFTPSGDWMEAQARAFLEHFDHIVSEYVAYYLECRPHQGIGNRLIGEAAPVTHLELRSLDEIRCEPRLGGLLKHYSRAA
jgi:hypothetical protein